MNRKKKQGSSLTMDLGVLLSRALDERWRKLDTQLKRNRRRCSEKSIHDLRVAMRRLIAIVDIVLAVLRDDGLSRTRRILKRHLKAFNPLRDLHIQLLQVQDLLQSFPQIKAFRTVLMLRERGLVKQAGRHVLKMRTARLEQTLAGAETRLAASLARPEMKSAARAAVVGAMAEAFARTANRRQAVSPSDGKSIHRVRVAFKRFRYVVEVLGPLLEGVNKEYLKGMNTYQVKMGSVQDIEVLIAGVVAYTFQRRQPADESFIAVHQELARRRSALIEAYLHSADDLFAFWKPQKVPS